MPRIPSFVAASTMLLAGCSTAAQVPQASITQVSSIAQSAKLPAQVIVSDTLANVVSIYDGAGHLQKRLRKGVSGPLGITTDAAGTLYVANGADSNVLIYAQPYTSPTLTLSLAGRYPEDVAVSKSGLVAVLNSSFPSGPGNVTFYAKGSTTPCANVTNADWGQTDSGAFDANGNLYLDGYGGGAGGPLIGEVTGGCSATAITTLSVANTLSGVGGIQVADGDVLVLDQGTTWNPVIYTYAPPAQGSLGSPIRTTPLSGGIATATFAMLPGNHDFWIVQSVVAYGRIEFTYPAGQFVQSFNEPNLEDAYGIAVNPAAIP